MTKNSKICNSIFVILGAQKHDFEDNYGFSLMNTSIFRIELSTPAQEEQPIFLAGNFNGWNANDKSYRLERIEKGKYFFEFENIADLPQPIEYKYTRGSWDDEELDDYGNKTPNRRLEAGTNTVNDYVPRWKKNGLIYDPGFLPVIEIISEKFEIPQLIKTRRIAALLPHDYHSSDKSYPVLYLQDGQNLFDEYAPFGSWELDKKLAILAERGLADLIIIAIDHAEEERIAEFTPSSKTKLGRGDGKKYVRFLADTLKPYIDKNYRTLTDRSNTGIGGSSMGGLISIYAGLMYPEVYEKLLIFSPALWVMPNIHFHALNLHDTLDMKIYLYGGEKESENMIPNIKGFRDAISRQGVEANIEFETSIDPKGKHNEKRWGEEFPKAVEWLFFR